MANTPGFEIVQNGIWPEEKYTITFDKNIINPALAKLPAENLFRFENGYILPINFISNFEYYNCAVDFDSEGLTKIDTFDTTSLVWAVSSERLSYNIGNRLNSFSIDLKNGARVPDKFCSYLLYPQRLFLKPVSSPYKNGDNWVLQTETVLIDSRKSAYANRSYPDEDASTEHIFNLYNPPQTISIPSNSKYSIIYNLSACRTRVERPVIVFDGVYNPSNYTTILEPTPFSVSGQSRIRPDSTFISYNVDFYAKNDTGVFEFGNLGQARPDVTPGLKPTFKSSYVLTPNILSSGKLISYQLLQIKDDGIPSIPLGNSIYCVLSALINLEDSNFTYYNKNVLKSNGTIVNWTTGVEETYIGVSYIADCPVFSNTNETWQETLISTDGTELGTPVPSENSHIITWTTKYPPHYYSYKASVINETNPDILMETSHLTFYVTSDILSSGYTEQGYTTAFCLSTYIHSDYKFIEYDLWNGASNDYIKFKPTVNSNSIFLSSLCCYYGDSLDIPYSLVDTPWVPASASNNFLITYPKVVHGELDFSIRPTLCSIAGEMDAYKATRINIAIGQLPENKGNNIFIVKIKEQEDYMEIDSSFLNSDKSWPSRDLQNSYISWDVYPKSTFLKLFSIDNTTGRYIREIIPNQKYLFNNNSYSVAISGYGPITTSVTLSSEKYNETSTVSSNSALFDFFSEGMLLVGPSVPLNNLNLIRTIELTAAIPYKGRTYELPSSIQMDWSWTYNTNYSFFTTPISAYYNGGYDFYPYGNTLGAGSLSSVQFKIQPNYSITSPLLNRVTLIASVDTQEKLLQGVYEFFVDDFPSPNILNSFFTVKYKNYSNVILDTSTGFDTITRKNDGTNLFNLNLKTNYSGIPNSTLKWSIEKNVNGTTTQNFINSLNSIDLDLNEVSSTIVVAYASNVKIAGWQYPHNVSSKCYFYVLDPTEFDKELEFISFPEYTWKNGEKTLTLLNNTNFDVLTANSVYGNKKSKSQTFYLSANNDSFTQFKYHKKRGVSSNVFDEFAIVNSNYELVEIPYNTSQFDVSGMFLALTAYNDTTFPEKNGVSYLAPYSGKITTLYYNNFTKNDYDSNNILKKPPVILEYPKITHTFVCNNTAIDVDVFRNVSITQTISSQIYNSPAELVQGTVTYMLSSLFWTIYRTIPATNGTFNIFNLLVGDPSEVRTVSSTRTNTLVLMASSNINAKIFPSTFDNYTISEYPLYRDLWESENQKKNFDNETIIKTSSDTANYEIFVSTAYSLTGEDVLVQYECPTNVDPGSNIVVFATDFGEDDSYFIHPFDETIRYKYKNIGTYYISTTAFYQNNTTRSVVHRNPIFIKGSWDIYDPNDLRFVEEMILTFPYSKEDIHIQPNQWGDADIFNNSILNIQRNLEFLQSNLKTLDTLSPTIVFGWLGLNSQNPSAGIRWHTRDFYSDYYLTPLNAASDKRGFYNIIDAVETENNIFVLHNTNTIIGLSAGVLNTTLNLENLKTIQDVVLTPTNIEINENESAMFLCDSAKNKIYRFELELNILNPTFNYSISLGGLGSDFEPNRFNSPSELIYGNGSIYILDYNNFCVKQYNQNLSWLYTYYSDTLNSDNPIAIAIHPVSDLLYVLTKSNTLYIYDQFNSNHIGSFKIKPNITNVVKIIFDEAGDFIYVVTKNAVFKYSPFGYFITELALPTNLEFVGAKKGKNRSILLICNNCILKIQDILKTHEVGRGLQKKYWSNDQLTIKRDEFASDTNYNRCLIRLAQNIKTFRNSINYKLSIVTEQIATDVVSYLATVPLDFDDLPVFSYKIENETLGVGINELHTPQVINRELDILIDAMNSLKYVFDIQPQTVDTQGCTNQFCWSWNSTTCYKFSFPSIKLCNINPITYQELYDKYPLINTPSSKWEDTVSSCCENVEPPV